MRFRSVSTALLALLVVAVACFAPACGLACAAKMPCHDTSSMSNCDGMMQTNVVQAAPMHVATCAQDEAVMDRSDFDLHPLDTVRTTSLQVNDVVQGLTTRSVRVVAKSPPRLISVMRV